MSSPSLPGWSVGNYPAFAEPWVGYLYWRLQSGQSPQAALTQFVRRYGPSVASPAQAQSSLAIAQQLLLAAELARSEDMATSFAAVGLGLFPRIGPTHVLGVRVRAVVLLADGTTREVSVLVNTAANAPLAVIAEQAADWLRQVAQREWGERYKVEDVVSMDIAEISGRAYGNQALTIGPG